MEVEDDFFVNFNETNENKEQEKDIDLYSDLDHFVDNNNQGSEENNLEEKLKNKEQECEKLKKQVELLKSKLIDFQKVNQVLQRNISCLFSTAQLEIERKDNEIKTLKNQTKD